MQSPKHTLPSISLSITLGPKPAGSPSVWLVCHYVAPHQAFHGLDTQTPSLPSLVLNNAFVDCVCSTKDIAVREMNRRCTLFMEINNGKHWYAQSQTDTIILWHDPNMASDGFVVKFYVEGPIEVVER